MVANQLLIRAIRTCFAAGTMFPMWCQHNGWSKVLIVGENDELLCDIRSQFHYCKIQGMSAVFFLLNTESMLHMSCSATIGDARFKKFDATSVESSRFDAILCLSEEKLDVLEKVMYLEEVTSSISTFTFAERPVYNYLNNHPGVRMLVMNVPILNRWAELSSYESHLMDSNPSFRGMVINGGRNDSFGSMDDLGYTHDELVRLTDSPKVITDRAGGTSFADADTGLLGTEGRGRRTSEQPASFSRTVYFLGTCTLFGFSAPWNKTLESFLQRRLNDAGIGVRIVNASQYYASRYQDIFYNLEMLDTKPGDIVVLCLQGLSVRDVPFLNVRDMFKRPHNHGEVFVDRWHINERGYKALADCVFDYLTENDFLDGWSYVHHKVDQPHMYGIPSWAGGFRTDGLQNYEKELTEYKGLLRRVRNEVIGRIGAIVMNCNPFTLGHKHLIEYAVARVSHLFIFVVEEDKSVFSFEDRIDLVRKGTEDFPNVTVLPSGRFIISSLTFSEYFNKSSLQEQQIDPTLDVELFAKEIAPELGISVRYAGEEPIDHVTMQYNETMRQILPTYGIDFVTIPRKKSGDEVISASRVRKLLQEDDMDAISHMVPSTTLEYLRKNADTIRGKLTQKV